MHNIKEIRKNFEEFKNLIKKRKSETDFDQIIFLDKNMNIIAMSDLNFIAAIKHKKYNVHGVQFHPESIRTKEGMKLLKNFLTFK